jgi:hypothetical protein
MVAYHASIASNSQDSNLQSHDENICFLDLSVYILLTHPSEPQRLEQKRLS